ncbi:MAG: serine hydrolase [Cyanobacteria bacterium M_DeepCast_200m_mx_001]|nr:serine hydrolase [Cyanobacteria bacterium M_DeepCast_200m_mx_001]
MSASRPNRPSSSTPGWGAPVQLVVRLLVMGLGLGVITGTALKLLAPRLAGGGPATPAAPTLSLPGVSGLPRGLGLGRFEPRTELSALSQKWAQLASAHKDLQVSGYLLVLDDGRFAQLNPERPLPAASSIKTPILLAGLEELDAGRLKWNEPLTLTKEVMGGGAGWMASRPQGTRFPFWEAATEMIRVSDNSATNLLIKRLGGKASLNARFQAMGLSGTVINNWLPDLDGTNTTSAHDLARAIALVDTGDKLSPRARDLFREVMGTSRTNTLLPLGLLMGLGGDSADPDSDLLGYGVTVLNKTGDIGIAYADGGLIELPNGQRAVAAFMVKGPFNDPRSTDLIRAMAAEVARTLIGKPGGSGTPRP